MLVYKRLLRLIKSVVLGLISLFVLVLVGCTSPLVKTEIVKVPVTQFIDIPEAYTAIREQPSRPTPNCIDVVTKEKVLCNIQIVWLLDQTVDQLNRANADKQAIASISKQIIQAISK